MYLFLSLFFKKIFMASYLKKSLFTLAGFGDPALLPPAEYLATIPQHEEGEDDCTGCFNPCTEHKEFPPHLKIDQAIPMLGSVQPYGRHIIIATGTSDWPYHITNAKDTFAHSLYNAERHNNYNAWKNMITNSSLVSLYSTIPGSCDVMILPDNIMISNVTCDTADDFYSLFLSVPLPIEPMDIDLMMRDDRLGEMKIQKSPYKTLLLLCSHRKVDKRCGITAPILAQELDQLLREKSLDEHDAAILMVSHIGGT